MALISILDTYYSFIKSQMSLLGATITVSINGQPTPIAQPFGGVVNAADWPQQPLVNPVTPEGTLFLLVINAVEVPSREVSTESQTLYQFQCQWVWVLLGSDIQNGQQGMNRGDRYRTNLQIIDNLNQSHFPGFTQQKDYAVDSEGNVTSQFSTTPYPANPIEIVRWSNLRFMPKSENQKTGLVYGAAQVDIFGYSNIAPALNA